MENKFKKLDFAKLDVGLLTKLYEETSDPLASGAIKALRALALGYKKDAAMWLVEGLIYWRAAQIAKEEVKQSCPVTGQNPKQLRRFKVTLRRAVLHNSDNKPQLATIVLCFAGNPSQEEVEVAESLIQLTDYAADATEEETAKWYELAERWVREFDSHFPIVWSEEFGVEGLIQDITQWQ